METPKADDKYDFNPNSFRVIVCHYIERLYSHINLLDVSDMTRSPHATVAPLLVHLIRQVYEEPFETEASLLKGILHESRNGDSHVKTQWSAIVGSTALVASRRASGGFLEG
jgi:hypothetical protein